MQHQAPSARNSAARRSAAPVPPVLADDSATNPIRLQMPRSSTSVRAQEFPFLAAPVEPDELGRLGTYRVLELLGKGGMAFVFLAEDIALRRRVALKVMKPDLDRDVDGWQRFLREARIMAALKHDHLVTVYQVGEEQGVVFLAMELLHGETLEDWSNGHGSATALDLVRLGKQIAAGLAVIHQAGLVHRDIKPGNLWLETPGERVKILDFGLARAARDSVRDTLPGMVVGTPAFMSPEQARGEAVDARSDLFSLGAVLYRLATGTPPFGADNTMGILAALAHGEAEAIQVLCPELPRSLGRLIMQLLAKSPDERPVAAEEVRDQLARIEQRLLDPTPRSGPRRSKPAARKRRGSWLWLLAGIAVVGTFAGLAVLAAVGLFLLRPTHGAGTTHLSELQPAESVNWFQEIPPPPPDEHLPPPPKGRPAVSVHGKPSPHGLFMHGPVPFGGTTRITYRLDGRYQTFRTTVSLNDGPPQSQAPLTFAVYGDGKLLWQSRPVHWQGDTQPCELSVRGVRNLTLEMQCAGSAAGSHAVWVEPRLER